MTTRAKAKGVLLSVPSPTPEAVAARMLERMQVEIGPVYYAEACAREAALGVLLHDDDALTVLREYTKGAPEETLREVMVASGLPLSAHPEMRPRVARAMWSQMVGEAGLYGDATGGVAPSWEGVDRIDFGPVVREELPDGSTVDRLYEPDVDGPVMEGSVLSLGHALRHAVYAVRVTGEYEALSSHDGYHRAFAAAAQYRRALHRYQEARAARSYQWQEEVYETEAEAAQAIATYVVSELDDRDLGAVIGPAGTLYYVRVTVALEPQPRGAQAPLSSAAVREIEGGAA